MPLTDASLNSLGTSLAGLITHASLHTADPGSTGTNESAAARKAVTFSVDGDGDLTLSNGPLAFTGGTANGAVTHVGLWSASTGGTFRGSFALPASQTFNASGAYNVTGITVNGTSTNT
jgi:hypothetical protein